MSIAGVGAFPAKQRRCRAGKCALKLQYESICNMKTNGKKRLIIIAAAALFNLGLVSSAIASPPLSRTGSSLSTINSARPISAIRRSLDQREHTLDLRLTRDLPSTDFRGGGSARDSTASPPAIHHFGVGDRSQLATLGTVDESFRVMSQPETFARRVHREGLPAARLWETKSALVSIGLNQRGKPGLWLIQKIH
jgi:hypothetical protein